MVLTGRNTASGAEIVVGALQSLGRALVVGDKFRAERQALDDLGGDEARTRKLDDATEIERDSYLDEVLAICRDYWRQWNK